MLNVRDAKRHIHGTVHGSRVDYFVAALGRFLPAEELP